MTYKDPLHVPSSELVVSFQGEEVMVLNKRMLDQQNCWENLDLIKDLHLQRLKIEDLMNSVENPHDLVSKWTEVQFSLQRAWGFPEDRNRHRFWDIPACSCPMMDNHDAYPTGYYVVSGGCKVHGVEVKK